jgi:hypothetical protein
MKYGRKTLVRHGLAVALGLGMLCASGFAQDASATKAADLTSQSEDQSLEEKIQKYKVDIETFKPSKIKDFLDLIQDQVSTPLNIIVTRNLASVVVPPMQLKQVSVQAALNAAVTGTESEILWDMEDEELRIMSQKV